MNVLINSRKVVGVTIPTKKRETLGKRLILVLLIIKAISFACFA